MRVLRQAGAFDIANESGSLVAPLSTMRQGNIFDSVYGPGPRLTIFFGHVGYDERRPAWLSFRDSNPALKDIASPFESVVSPLQVGPHAWLWFVPSGVNNGMADNDLLSNLDAILDWAKERRFRFIVTNGIRDVDHGRDTAANRASDDRRTSMLTKYLYRRERADRLQVEVVSLNDVFVRYWAA